MLKSRSILAVAIALPMLAGCATLRGAQDSVPGLTPRDLVPMSEAVLNYHSPDSDNAKRSGLTRRGYREYVVSAYLAAIDSKYKVFVDQLNSSDRGSALGFDLLQLGLGGATILAGSKSIDELATISTVAAGARASVDKRLFFDRTLPALIASMDAERTTIKADIARKRALPGTTYSLDEARDDLSRLVEAGRLDRAMLRITNLARADQVAAQDRLDQITAACDEVTANSSRLNEAFRTKIKSKAENLAMAATALEVTLPAGSPPDAVERAVRLAFTSKLCTDQDKQDLINQLT